MQALQYLRYRLTLGGCRCGCREHQSAADYPNPTHLNASKTEILAPRFPSKLADDYAVLNDGGASGTSGQNLTRGTHSISDLPLKCPNREQPVYGL